MGKKALKKCLVCGKLGHLDEDCVRQSVIGVTDISTSFLHSLPVTQCGESAMESNDIGNECMRVTEREYPRLKRARCRKCHKLGHNASICLSHRRVHIEGICADANENRTEMLLSTDESNTIVDSLNSDDGSVISSVDRTATNLTSDCCTVPILKNRDQVNVSSGRVSKFDRRGRRRLKCRKCGRTGHRQSLCPAHKVNSVKDTVANDVERRRKMYATLESDNGNLVHAPLMRRCSRCHVLGHNKRTCNAVVVETDANEENVNCEIAEGEIVNEVPMEVIEEIAHENDQFCCVCHRCNTDDYNLNLRALSDNYRPQQFGDRDVLDRESSLICKTCSNYCDSSTRNGSKWKFGWAATLFSFLTDTSLKCNAKDLVEFFPMSIRESFRLVIPQMKEEVAALWTIPSKFLDKTKLNEQLVRLKNANRVNKYQKMCDRGCFPDVICPQGCNVYLDGTKEETDVLPACDYLASICPGFRAFNSKKKMFVGKDNRWPFIEKQLKYTFEDLGIDFVVGATLLADAENGLSIVVCSSGKHALGEKYNNPAPNPVLCNMSHLSPDGTGPATVVPNFERNGRSNELNSSSAVLKERGDVRGASSFMASTRALVHRGVIPQRERHSMGFALSQRPDIMQALVEGQILPAKFYRDLVEGYEKECKISDDVIKHAKSSGTYVAKSDCVKLLKSYNSRHVSGGRDETFMETKARGDELLQVVHPANEVGQELFELPYICNKRDNKEHGLVLSILVHSLMNCQFLHALFLEQLHCVNDNKHHVDLQKVIKCVAQGKKPKNVVVLESKLIDHICNMDDNNRNRSPEEIAVAILSYLCRTSKIHLSDRNRRRLEHSLESAAGNASKVLLVSKSQLQRYTMPLHLQDRKFELVYASRHMYDVAGKVIIDSDSRWTPDFNWQHSVLENGYTSLSSSGSLRMLDWEYAVYIETPVVNEMTNEQYLNMSGGQTKLKCSIHEKGFMMKEPYHSLIKCSMESCRNTVKYRCSKGFGSTVTGQCQVGVCDKHAKRIFRDDNESGVIVGTGSTVQEVTTETERSYESEVNILEDETVNDLEEIVADVEFNVPTMSGGTDLPGSTPILPNTFINESTNVSGHYLLNHHLCCRASVNINRKSPVSMQKLLTHIHSIGCEQSLPLLQPEALLFPQIFWATIGDSVIGALPSVMYSEYGKRSVYGGFASLVDHIRVRLATNRSLTSRDPNYIAYMFDVYLDCLLQSNSVLVAMKKGLEHINKTFIKPETREFCVNFNETDARREVNRLSNYIKDHPWRYFLTLTCADSTTTGVWPIRKALEMEYGKNTEELHIALQNHSAILCRAWERTVRHFFDYLLHSKEKILGDISNYWYRFEFQGEGSQGNRPHVHAGLTLDPKSVNEDVDLSRVANRMIDMFCSRESTDFDTLHREGIVKDFEDYKFLYNLGHKLTQHSCENSKFKCQKVTSDGTKRCRVRRSVPCQKGYFVEHPCIFDEETEQRLLELGLACRKYENWRNIQNTCVRDVISLAKELSAGHYNYPAESSEFRVPSHGRIFSVFRSMVNLQLCDKQFMTSYLVKYAAGADEKREVFISKEKSCNEVRVDAEGLYHSKISGCNIAQKDKNANTKGREALAREICLTEMIWFTLGLPYIRSSVEFVEFSTQSPEHRCSVVRRQGGFIKKLINEDGSLVAVTSRAELPRWRQFTQSQIILMKEIANSKYMVDNTSAFSIRPPELHSVCKLSKYLKWFTRRNVKKYEAAENLFDCPWIDGSGKVVKIRQNYITEWKEYLERGLNVNASVDLQEMLELCKALEMERNNNSAVKSDFYTRFVDSTAQKDVVLVPSSIDPRFFNKFLIHILLMYGNFSTELDLYSCPSLLHAFQKARLISDANNPTEEEALTITRNYVIDQLRYLPMGAKTKDRHLALVMDGLKKYFRTKELDFDEMPLASLRAIRVAADEKLVALEAERRRTLAGHLCGENIQGAPAEETVGSGREFIYEPKLERIPGQTHLSHTEQTVVLNACIEAIDGYRTVGSPFIKLPLIVGPPGAGKTHILQIAALYAMSKGLRIMITAVTGERARALGGEHIHLLFGIKYTTSALEAVHVTANKCLIALTNNPVKLASLKRLDVLFIEEIGLVPSHIFEVLDFVMRRVNDCSAPFGGVLVISSGDPRQLKPVEGKSIFISPCMFTIFKILRLKEFVRSRNDEDLQTIIKLMRKPAVDETEVNIVIDTVQRRCVPTNFVPSWSHVPDNYHRVVGKKSAVEHAVNLFLNDKIQTPGLLYKIMKANDETEVADGNWQTANVAITRQISSKVKEKYRLFLYVGQVVRLTHNNCVASRNTPRFAQGQLVVIIGLPDETVEHRLQRVRVKLMPPGFRSVSGHNIPDEWPTFEIGRRRAEVCLVRFQYAKARREQFPFDYYICSTVHKSIGETCTKLATQISCENKMFNLWDKDQLLTLLSRVPSLSDLMFVGSSEDTLKAIRALICKQDPWDVYVDKIIDNCDSVRVGRGILPASDRILSLNTTVPANDCGFVYMIISLKDPFASHIDECVNLRVVLRKWNDILHNRNSSHLRPWAVACFMCKFPGGGHDAVNQYWRKEILESWRSGLDSYFPEKPSSYETLCVGRNVFACYKENRLLDEIVFKECVKLGRQHSERSGTVAGADMSPLITEQGLKRKERFVHDIARKKRHISLSVSNDGTRLKNSSDSLGERVTEETGIAEAEGSSHGPPIVIGEHSERIPECMITEIESPSIELFVEDESMHEEVFNDVVHEITCTAANEPVKVIPVKRIPLGNSKEPVRRKFPERKRHAPSAEDELIEGFSVKQLRLAIANSCVERKGCSTAVTFPQDSQLHTRVSVGENPGTSRCYFPNIVVEWNSESDSE